MRFPVNGSIVADDDAAAIRYFKLDSFLPSVCPNDIRQAIADNPAGEELVLEINSPGGSLYSGFEMYSILAGAGCTVVAEVQSIAGSAASLLLPAASRVVCSPVGQVMIHLPSTSTEGNEIAHRQNLQMLQAATESIINAYAKKCKKKCSRDSLRRKMANETFLTAQEAMEIGLVDEILGEETPPADPRTVMNSAGAGFDLGKLRAAYAAAVLQDGGTPPPETDPFDHERARALLALETARFI